MTHETEEYHGWKNKPTWLLYTWLSNDYDSYQEVRELAADAVRESETPGPDLARQLKDRAEAMIPEQAGLDADLMQWAVAAIDFHAVAAAFIEEIQEQ